MSYGHASSQCSRVHILSLLTLPSLAVPRSMDKAIEEVKYRSARRRLDPAPTHPCPSIPHSHA